MGPTRRRSTVSARTVEEKFFHDLVELVRKDGRAKSFPRFTSRYCVNDYNLSAFSAQDGYIVLVDEIFYRHGLRVDLSADLAGYLWRCYGRGSGRGSISVCGG